MGETDADRRAEMPEDSRKVAGGTSERKERERQASTAVKEKTQPEAERCLHLTFHEPPYAERHVRWCGRARG